MSSMQASLQELDKKINKEWMRENFLKSALPSSEDERWRRSDPEVFNPSRLKSDLNHRAFEMNSLKQLFLENVVNAKLILENAYVLACTREEFSFLGSAPSSTLFKIEYGAECESLIQKTVYEDAAQEETLSVFASKAISFFHAAESRRNICLTISDHVSLDKPLVLFFPNQISSEVQSVFLKVGMFSKLSVFEVTETSTQGGQYLTKINLGESSHLTYTLLLKGSESNSDRSLHHFETQIEKDAQLKFSGVFDGVRGLRSMLDSVLQGKGASSDVRGIVIGKSRQHFDIEPRQLHKASRTFSNMMFKIALKDRARAVFQGDISIDRTAQNCEAYQMNKNLLLSSDARVDSLPKLNILPDQVKCKHGAATGSIDPNSLHYLMARGFSKEEATKLLVSAFFEEVSANLEDGIVRETLEIYLREKAKAFVNG